MDWVKSTVWEGVRRLSSVGFLYVVDKGPLLLRIRAR